MQVQFGEWRLDLDARQLCRGHEIVHVSPKAFQLLKLLLERRPQALSKAELQDAIWPATFVSEASLAQVVSEIRAAIGDDAHDPKFLRTVYGFGYAFAGGAVDISPPGSEPPTSGVTYWLLSESRENRLSQGENVLGRDPTATVRLESLRISRYHARIVLTADEAILEDLGSKNGTYLREARIAEPARLQHGDQIRVGPFSLTFHVSHPGSTTETETRM